MQRVWTEVQAQGERWTLWLPVSFGAGSAGYFAMKVEPSWLVAVAPAGVAMVAAVALTAWGRIRALAILAALLTFAVLGFADGKIATMLADAPVVPDNLGAVHIDGWVVDVASPSAGRARVLLAPWRISGVEPARLPARVRLTLRSTDPPEPGAAIRVMAILNPPPGPASPGGYDFAREAWFDGIGGVGLALTEAYEINAPDAAVGLKVQMALNRFRWRLASRLTADIRRTVGDGPGPGLAAAVSTSHQDWLNADEVSDLRNSGLAHMVAIAGLHTAAVTGFVFAAIRLGVAAFPWLALRVSGKKLAAAGGLAAACAYLLISGAHPPARRAAITASVAFLAILLDRKAVSLRSLAVAALIILALQPLAVVEPGFQMSFCATASLVAMAEIWPRHSGRVQAPWFVAWPQKLKDWLLAMLAISFVAGAATGPFALQYFNRMSSYGLFANLFADFVASALLMPALVVSGIGEVLSVDPVGLTPFLMLAGWSGGAILAIAHLFATAPGASHAMASAPPLALALAYIGIIVACLWRGRLRWCAAPLAGAVLLWPRPPPPVGWIAADGDNAAVVVDRRAIVLKPEVRTFASSAWTTHRGLITPFDPAAETDLAFDCNRIQCTPRYGTTPGIGAWWTKRRPSPEKLEALCRASDIVLLRAAVARPDACKSVMLLQPADFARGGAAEIYPAANGGWRLDWSSAWRGRRPWTAPSYATRNGLGSRPARVREPPNDSGE